MPVAPSFESYTRLSEPFIKNGKYYIKVKNPKTGTERDVRWYSDSECTKNYNKKIVDEGCPNLKKVRGFANGPILVIRGNKASDEEWLRQSVARYAMGIGWYITSEDTLPSDAPANFKYLLLGWNEFKGKDDYHSKEPKELSEIIESKIRNKEFCKF
jgi:hypothetical protein